MTRRTRKQVTYAGGAALGVMLVVLILALTISDSPPPLATPSVSSHSAITLEETAVLEHKSGNQVLADVVARLRNPNATAGVAEYTVTFIFIGTDGKEIGRQQEITYLLPGSIQYVAALGVSLSASVGQVRVELPAAQFTAVPATVTLPSFNSFVRERTFFVVNQKQFEEQKGIIRNTGTLDWHTVEVVAIAKGSGNITGVGKTFLGELRVGEQREFTIQWPLAKTPTEEVLIIPTTNIYREENIVKIIGDPALLR